MRLVWVLILHWACISPVLAWAEEPPATAPRHDGKTVAHWIAELKKPDVAARRKAAYAIFKLGPAARTAAVLLARCLEDEDAYVRDTAYKALIALKDDAPPTIKALRSSVNDGRPRVRRLAMWALLRTAPAAAFRDEDVTVRRAAIAVVIDPNDFLDEAVFGELVVRTGDEDEEIRSLAANAIGNAYIFHGQDRPYLVREQGRLADILFRMATKDEEAVARQWAVYALRPVARYPKGRDLTKRVLPALIGATRDSAPDVRAEAFRSLATTGKSQEAENACLVGVKDKHSIVRAAASGRLAGASEGGPRVIEALMPLLSDEHRFVRLAAAGSLGRFAEKSAAAVPALTERLRVETHLGVLGALAKALGDIGPAARPALPQLETAFAASREPSAAVAYALLRLGTQRRALRANVM